MSLKWREWIKLKKRKQLGLSEEDYNTLMNNIGHFCRISDEMIRETAGEDAIVNKEFDELPEEQKLDHTRDVIKEGLNRLKKKKKKVAEENNDEESTIISQKAQEKVQQEKTQDAK